VVIPSVKSQQINKSQQLTLSMKTILIPSPAEKLPFKPVTIQLTFETQEELDQFGGLCNVSFVRRSYDLPSYTFAASIGAEVERFSYNYLIDSFIRLLKDSSNLRREFLDKFDRTN
jgi:hypothetical protein